MQLVAVVKEWLPDEIAEFKSGFWPSEEIFLDEEQEMFKAINAGEPLRIPMSALANPFRHVPIDTCLLV